MSPRFGIVGPSYTSQSVNADAQQTMNWYPEQIESGAGNAPIVLYPTPGLKVFANLTASLALTKTHSGTWTQGQNGKTYTVTVTNNGPVDTFGTVTVTETAPSGLTFVSLSGSGWTIASNVATRTDPLAPGDSYPALTVTVNVNANATSPQVNSVQVSGGGIAAPVTATDSTVITAGTSLVANMVVFPAVTVGWNAVALGFNNSGSTPVLVQSPLSPNTVFDQVSNTNTQTSNGAFTITNMGDAIIVQASFLTAAAITPAISDTLGNNWGTPVYNNHSNGIQDVVWICIANASGLDAVTVTSSANCAVSGCLMWEVSNLSGTSTANAQASGTSSTPSAGTITLSYPHMFVVVIVGAGPAAINTLNAGAGWSQPLNALNLQNGANNLYIGSEYQIT